MGTSLGILAAKQPDFQIHGLVQFELFGQELWITTTHVSILIVCALMLIFALVVIIALYFTLKRIFKTPDVSEQTNV